MSAARQPAAATAGTSAARITDLPDHLLDEILGWLRPPGARGMHTQVRPCACAWGREIGAVGAPIIDRCGHPISKRKSCWVRVGCRSHASFSRRSSKFVIHASITCARERPWRLQLMSMQAGQANAHWGRRCSDGPSALTIGVLYHCEVPRLTATGCWTVRSAGCPNLVDLFCSQIEQAQLAVRETSPNKLCCAGAATMTL